MWWFFEILRAIIESGDDPLAEDERQKAGADKEDKNSDLSSKSEDDEESKSTTFEQTVVNPSLAATEGTHMATSGNSWFTRSLSSCCSCLGVSLD